MIKTPPADAFELHVCAPLFLDAAFEARESGLATIPEQKQTELKAQFVLGGGETAALAYLAINRVDDELWQIDQEILRHALGEEL